MLKTNGIIMSHSYSYIYPVIIQMMTTLTDCSKSSAYDNNDNNNNNKLVSDYMVKPFEYSFKGLFAE
jgi:hypothetical protein